MEDPVVAYLLREQARRKLTPAAMARALGVSRSHYWRIVNGHRPMTLDMAVRLRPKLPRLLTLVMRQVAKAATEAAS